MGQIGPRTNVLDKIQFDRQWPGTVYIGHTFMTPWAGHYKCLKQWRLHKSLFRLMNSVKLCRTLCLLCYTQLPAVFYIV